MLFCPDCGNMLLTEMSGMTRFFCKTCPYVYEINGRISQKVNLKKKVIDPILGSAAAWSGADVTENRCSKCLHDKAYWVQIQIRSSDEPMSRFYRCCNCGHQWRED